MRVLLVNDSCFGGGSITAFLNEALLLKEMGHEVALFTLGKNSPKTNHIIHFSGGIEFSSKISLNSNSFLLRLLNFINKRFFIITLITLIKFKKCIKNFKPDIIHFHSLGELNLPIYFKVPKKYGIKSILTVHTPDLVCPNGSLLKSNDYNADELCDGICSREYPLGQSCKTYRCISPPSKQVIRLIDYRKRIESISDYIDVITAPSQALKQIIESSVINNERIKIVQLDNVHQHKPEEQNNDRQKQVQKKYFLYSGRLVREKGIDLLLEIFTELRDINLIIMGDGPSKHNLEKIISENQLTNIQLIGWKNGEELDNIYKNSYALITPSVWFEVLGLVILDAYKFKKTVIASDSGGIPDIVKNNITGLIFKRNDLNEMKEKILYLWNNPDLAVSLGEAAYKYYQEKETLKYSELLKAFNLALEKD